jgi:serine acetyltransferase
MVTSLLTMIDPTAATTNGRCARNVEAGAVVIRDVPANTAVVGIPATSDSRKS